MDEEKVKKLIVAIESVETGKKNQNTDIFSALFDVIYRKLREGAKQKEILQNLKEQGFELSPATFRKLFESECDLRNIKIDKSKKGTARYCA